MDAAVLESALAGYDRALTAYALACCGALPAARNMVTKARALALENAAEGPDEAEALGEWLMAVVYTVWAEELEAAGAPADERTVLHELAGALFHPEFYEPETTWTADKAAVSAALAARPRAEQTLMRAANGRAYADAAASLRLPPDKFKGRYCQIRERLLTAITGAPEADA